MSAKIEIRKLPTPNKIRERCRKIRRDWTPGEAQNRRVMAFLSQLQILSVSRMAG